MPKVFQSILLAVVALTLGVGAFGMRMGMDMSMTPTCVLRGHEGRICPMSASSHVSAWQADFAAIPARSSVFLMALLVFGLLALVQWSGETVRQLIPFKGMKCRDAPIPGRNITIELISRGILQPTVYG